jgi:hypothetical protein
MAERPFLLLQGLRSFGVLTRSIDTPNIMVTIGPSFDHRDGENCKQPLANSSCLSGQAREFAWGSRWPKPKYRIQ